MKVTPLLLLWLGTAAAQGIITTVAGGDWVFTGDGQPGLNAPLGTLGGIAVDPQDQRPAFVDTDNCLIGKISADGILHVIAGNGCFVFATGFFSSGDGGPATQATFRVPTSIAYDSLGNYFVGGLTEIRKIAPNGTISTVARASNGDFYLANGLAADAAGNLYIADLYSNRVRRLTPQGQIATIIGDDSSSHKSGRGADNGTTNQVLLTAPRAVALDLAGNLYIADSGNARVLKVTSAGFVSTVVSNFGAASLAFDRAGTLYLSSANAFYAVPLASLPVDGQTLKPLGGSAQDGYSGDGGPSQNALFRSPLVIPDNLGNLYVADSTNFRVRGVSGVNAPGNRVSTLAGNGLFRSAVDGTRALDAPLNEPASAVVDKSGNLYFSQSIQNRVFRVNRQGVLNVIAGTGQAGASGDGGPAISATLRYPAGLAADAGGNLYIADQNNSKIRKVTPGGAISTFATLSAGPRELTFDGSGNLYVSCTDSRVRKIDPSASITIVAGPADPNAPNGGYTGDNGPATQAQLNGPAGLAIDANGSLYISDSGNNVVRRVDSKGIITTYAGQTTPLRLPTSLVLDSAGNLYVSEVNRSDVTKVSPAGIQSTFAGLVSPDQVGDGKLSTSAAIDSPSGLAIDAAGDIFIVDAGANRIREVLANAPALSVTSTDPSLAKAPVTMLSFTAASGGPTVTQTVLVQSTVTGVGFQVAITVSGSTAWLSATPAADSAPRQVILTVDPANLKPGSYSATVAISPVNTGLVLPASIPISVSLTVGAVQPPQLSVDRSELSFTAPQGVSAQIAPMVVANIGGQILNYFVTTSTAGGGAWLSALPNSPQATPNASSTLNVTANPAGLAPGVYNGTVAIHSTGGDTTVPVIMTVSSIPQAVLLTQTGMTFTAVEQGGVIPSQSVGVVSVGTGVMKWTASASTTTGANWLTVTPTSGSSDATGSAPQIAVTANASGLAPGRYYGTVRISAPTTANRSRLLTVFLNVLPAGTQTPAMVQPPELVFAATPGGGSPGSQTLAVYNVVSTPRSFTAIRSAGGFEIFTVPSGGTLDPSHPTLVTVQPYSGSFAAGTQTGSLTFQFSDGTVQSVRVRVVSVNPPVRTTSKSGSRPADGPIACPQQLVVSLGAFNEGFQVSVGWPVALSARVVDACQNPVVAGQGTVWAHFDDGEDDVPLTPLGDGTWQGTWKPDSHSAHVGVTIFAKTSAGVTGSTSVTGNLASPQDQPRFTLNSIGSVFAPPTPVIRALAPGSFIQIFGTRLADSTTNNINSPPYSTGPLANTQVLFDSLPAPIQSASDGQINVLVPYGVNLHTTSQVRIQRDDALSEPVAVDIAEAQPSILQSNGIAYVWNPTSLVTAQSPAKAGDYLVMYAVGLGVTDQPITDGAVSPGSPPGNTPGVSLTIGGQPAAIPFAGLTPFFVGLYQINAVMPAGVPPGQAALAATVSGQTSPELTIAVQ